MTTRKRKYFLKFLTAVILVISVFFLSPYFLTAIGGFLIVSDDPTRSDAVVVLNSGVELYPRLMEAADIYRKGLADKVVINGNRKIEAVRELEKIGFEYCCPWDEESLRILSLLGVPRDHVISVSAEDAYDTVSEAKTVGDHLIGAGMKTVIIATSKYHTRRARHIWRALFADQIQVYSIPAEKDPFSPDGWWKNGRQIRWVLAEYGAWGYYYWNLLTTNG